MNAENIMKVFSDTAYIRVGGRPEEKKAAEYLRQQVAQFGLEAVPWKLPSIICVPMTLGRCVSARGKSF